MGSQRSFPLPPGGRHRGHLEGGCQAPAPGQAGVQALLCLHGGRLSQACCTTATSGSSSSASCKVERMWSRQLSLSVQLAGCAPGAGHAGASPCHSGLSGLPHPAWLRPCLHLQRYGPDNAVLDLDREGRTVTLKNGNKLQYDALITTMPLDITLQWCGQKKWADGLTRRCGPTRVDLCIGLLAVPGTVAVSAIVHRCVGHRSSLQPLHACWH